MSCRNWALGIVGGAPPLPDRNQPPTAFVITTEVQIAIGKMLVALRGIH